jgi:hypothetical protein
MKSIQHTLRQHDYSGAMIKQFSNVSGLYAWFMSSSGLVPVPFPRSTWEDLGISEFPEDRQPRSGPK